MYQFSVDPNNGWIGDYESPFQALENGRSQYGNDTTLFVRLPRQAYYIDFMPEIRMMLAEMKERAAEATGDQGADSFSTLTEKDISELSEGLREAFFRWEVSLAEDRSFGGFVTAKTKRYLDGQYPTGADGW